MKRIFDIVLALMALIITIVPQLLIAAMVRLTSPGPALHWSDRIGKYNRVFSMPKFRTMKLDTPAVATHLLSDPDRYVTPVGRFLRRTSLDELPQLLSILRGDMSFVGPRPALFNQDDLVAQRTTLGVHELTPGLTGWAQVNGRDELSIDEKARLDAEYLMRRSLGFDMAIIARTAWQAIAGRGVAH